MAASITSIFQTLLTHPSIINFKWEPPQTPLSSLSSLITALILYLSLTLFLYSHPRYLPSTLLKPISAVHNFILLSISVVMAIFTSLSSLYYLPSLTDVFCFPRNTAYSSSSGPVFYWAYIFYLSKYYELIDTILILLNPCKPLTFLHVYHHAVVLIMCYLWLETRQSLMPIALVTNASVHVVMYSYYLSSSVGWRWSTKWKKTVTLIQMLQFVVSFGFSLVFLWMHFNNRDGCEGMKGWVFNACFNASLLALFFNFHTAAYPERRNNNNNE